MSHYCKKCGKTMDDKEFYISKNLEKYPPDGRLDTCKKCLTMHVDNWDPETYLWILQEVDVPYIKEEWDKLLAKYSETAGNKITGMTIIGRYLSKMKLKQFKEFHWSDTETIANKALEEKVLQMKTQGLTDDEIEEQLSIDRTPPKPRGIAAPVGTPDVDSNFIVEDEEEDEFADQLTDEDKVRMRLKWGSNYKPSEWVRMEQLYEDMMKSYDIQGAGHKDTLIMICKASLKANQLIDAGDVEGFQKMSKVYNELMKSGKFTAAQNKAESGEFVDSVGELVAVCEREGFIPRYYVDSPQDSVDKTLLDLQQYTKTLVTEEMNLGNMIESSLKQIEQDRANESTVDTDDADQEFEDGLFEYRDNVELEDADYSDYYDAIEKEREEDAKLHKEGQ